MIIHPIALPLVAVLALAFSGVSLAEDAVKEPAELTRERAKYEAELQAATKKINASHVERLKTLQKKAMADGDLDGAMAIREEIKKYETNAKVKDEVAAGIPEGVAFLEGDWIYHEGSAAYALHIDGNGHINWGDWYYPTANRKGKKMIQWVNDRGGVVQTVLITNSNLLEPLSADGKKIANYRWERVKKADDPKSADKAEGK